MHRGNCGADEVLADGHRRRDGHDGEDAFLEQGFPERVNSFLRTEHNRSCGGFAAPGVEAEVFENGPIFFCIRPEAVVMFPLLLHDFQRGLGARGGGGADGRTEHGLFAAGA